MILETLPFEYLMATPLVDIFFLCHRSNAMEFNANLKQLVHDITVCNENFIITQIYTIFVRLGWPEIGMHF